MFHIILYIYSFTIIERKYVRVWFLEETIAVYIDNITILLNGICKASFLKVNQRLFICTTPNIFILLFKTMFGLLDCELIFCKMAIGGLKEQLSLITRINWFFREERLWALIVVGKKKKTISWVAIRLVICYTYFYS